MKARDQAEFRDYVIARKASLLRTAYLLSGDSHRAEDLVSTTVIKLYGAWKSARDATHTDAYVRRILVRVFLDERRRPWRREHPTEVLPEPLTQADETPVHRTDLRRLLDQMPPRQRAVLVLRFLDDLSVDQTAGVVRCSEGAVKTLTSRALDSIRCLLPAGVTTRTDYEEAL
ncbi:SigE family RNA polymerase sigma factor [Kribbella sp. NBC_01245]|uniref:SigE family RNA polymerase sigma factor n=1 Tax=Kribbella sp. NBC_01245 TaxID=2903578 RepID=UPI002E2D62EF|nr:SigE family RNA polymerase sigma factor [Kribbella sp. NBC_01245]